MAKIIKDRRRQEKAIREAKNNIAKYSESIPDDIKDIFNNQVGANSLNYQHADDIDQCIELLKKLIQDEKNKQSQT